MSRRRSFLFDWRIYPAIFILVGIDIVVRGLGWPWGFAIGLALGVGYELGRS